MTVVVLTCLLVLPATLSDGGPQARAERSDLEVAEDGLKAAQVRLDDAAARLEGIDARIAASALELRATEAALAVARGQLGDAAATQLEAADDLATSTAALQSAEEAVAGASSALTNRVRARWAQGPAAELTVRLRAVLGATDVHRILAAERGIDRLLVDAQRQQRAAADARRVAVAARTAPTAIVDDARRRLFSARSDLTQLQRLERAQLAILADLEAEQLERRTLLAELAADRDVLVTLVERLRLASLGVSLEGALAPPLALPLDGPAPSWAAGLPPRGRTWAPMINGVAARSGLDGALLAALVWTESGFNPSVVSHAGAIGLSQLMPGTASGLGVDPWDPADNLRGGARYLVIQLHRFQRLDLGLAAYNAGPGRVEQAGGAVPSIVETQLYVVRVLERWAALLAVSATA